MGSQISLYASPPDTTRTAVLKFLDGIAQPLPPRTPIEKSLFKDSCAAAVQRGWPADTAPKYMGGGVAMSSTGYAHLDNNSTRILIAVYTACGIYLDDVYQHNTTGVSEFNQRFFEHVPQADPVLDCFAQILLEIGDHFDRVVANIIVTSTLNAVTALTLEARTQGMAISPSAIGYPTFSRVMSGASEAYSLFIFPRSFVLPQFIQTLQQLMTFINNGNDILSFHKEESDGETVNRVSFLAQQSGKTKQTVLVELVADAIQAHRNVLDALASTPAAQNVFQAFVAGYIGFHVSAGRYRLEELALSV
ncbi:unnamed protein product [Mycena citricolor]|uniref:Terpenoid synthase n=1 Tax=Mycena citricolor TaxID=2018698 RepID=A0AAD2H199_9AGAR|nr:unnamed protein product [Mycena citricolor]CAK5273984.1 unnamed protein product [Mycena citricolor]